MSNYQLKGFLIAIMTIIVSLSKAQTLRDLEMISNQDGTVTLMSIKNTSKAKWNVDIDGKGAGIISAGEKFTCTKICNKSITVNGIPLWRYKPIKTEQADNVQEEQTQETSTKDPVIEQKKSEDKKSKEITPESTVPAPIHTHQVLSTEDVMDCFNQFVESDDYYSIFATRLMNKEVDGYVDALKNINQDNRDSYIAEHQLRGYLNDARDSLQQHESGMDAYIENFYSRQFPNADIKDKSACTEEIKSILNERLTDYKDAIARLGEELEESTASDFIDPVYLIGCVFVCVLLVFFFILYIRKRNAKRVTEIPVDTVQQAAKRDIVVRRQTKTILKKQSLEDVQDNPAYFEIRCSDFCSDSAVRKIYLKNTCVKDIYNMYADDLRNPENPNEDGCMVLGRWVCDTDTKEYYVSLEEIVKPGDDAIFAEYELNFGGKIKLKVSDKLRKLRRERNLQYDMTCWVHSHPGLGVFFSNADTGVHDSLKHPTHPGFLVAIVVDILTPNQEFGIFTFKHDMSINSKAELRKMYSLEELYQWAVESDKISFKPEEHYEVLQTAQQHDERYMGVELSNGSIIDICQMETAHETGLVGWVHGYDVNNFGKKEVVANKISKETSIPDNEQVGALVIGSRLSIPTIKKYLNSGELSIKFVLFYSTATGMLTTIPVIGGQLASDEKFYSEVKLEDLKIWTRRKR